MKAMFIAAFLMLSGATTANAGAWGEVRYAYSSYGAVRGGEKADNPEISFRDTQGSNWEGRVGYAGSSRWSPGLSVAKYSAGRDGQSSSWAMSALVAYRSRRPEHLAGFGVDFALGVIRTDRDFAGGSIKGVGPNVAVAFALEPQVAAVTIPLFIGVRYAAIRNGRFEGPVQRGVDVLDYSGVFFGVGARLGRS
jgi:hypothetical protein